MQKTIFLFLTMLFTYNIYATNGDNMIAASSISRAMGGTGFAYAMGSESILKNPALMTSTKSKFELSFGGMLFQPKVTGTVANNSADSDADTFVIPALGFTYRLGDKLIFGIGAYGVSGLGVDYRDQQNLSKMSTALNLMKFAPAIAYQQGNFSIGVGASILYGTLGISYYYAPQTDATDFRDTGRGVSDDLGLGFDIGISYAFEQFTIGANFKSAISMSYDHQIANAAKDFIMSDVTTDKMEQPAEYGIGVAYYYEAFAFTADYKKVLWSKADGYKEFGWEDQDVIALGFAYQLNKTILRLGYNHAKTPLGPQAINNSTTTPRNAVNFFNLIGFPATSEDHYTAGLSHEFSSIFALDISYVLSPETTKNSNYNNGSGELKLATTHKESSVSIAGRWRF